VWRDEGPSRKETQVVRKFVVLLVAAGALLLAAGPALAKEGEGAEVDGVTVAITGPGLRGPIVLGRDDGVTFDDQLQTLQEMARMTVRPTVALGPRYQVLMTVRCLNNGYTTSS